MVENSNGRFVQAAIPKFDGHYDHWVKLMENFLRSKEYWCIIEAKIYAVAYGAVPTDAQLKMIKEQKLKDLKAKNYLYQAIDRDILETILNTNTAKHIWDSMKQKFQGSTRVKRAQLQALRRDFEVLGMKDGETVNAFFACMLTIANKMKACGESMRENVITEKILRSMVSKFDYVVCSIEESNNLETMMIDELQSSLLVHEQRMRCHVEEEHALKVTHEDRAGKGRGRALSRGGRGRGTGRQSFNKVMIECFKCHKLGHYQYECPEWKEKTNYAELNEEDELLLMSYVDFKQVKQEELCFLDSGCNNHISGNMEWFSELDESFRQTVKLGNNSRMVVVGQCCVRLRMNGFAQVISNVYYIPELKNNLLSIGQL